MADEGLLASMRSRGAVLTDVDGRTTPAHFGDAREEYRALRDGAALVDLAWMDCLKVTGGDRVEFLQGMLSNDVKQLGPGEGCPTLLLSEQGKVVADLLALIAAEEVVLAGHVVCLAAARTALERFIVADDVEIGFDPGAHRSFALFGPAAIAACERLGIAAPAGPYGHAVVEPGGIRTHVARVASPDGGGVLCRVSAASAAPWWDRALAAGVVPAGRDAFDVWRIESGVPWYGRDVTADTLALEAPYEAAISFRKGCYLGQEVMERVTARGHVNRRLVGIEVAGAVVPPSGTRLFAGERDVGWVTSAARSWRLDRVVGLAYVRREHLEPGTTLALESAGGPAATVHGLPF